MDALPRYLTLIVKEFMKYGFADSTERLLEITIKAMFEGMAERAILFLRDFIRKGMSYFNNFKSRFSNNSNEKHENSNNIFNIIFKLIIEFCSSFDFEMITQYIKAAINLLKKLLGKFSEFKQWAYNRMNKTTTPKNEESTALCTRNDPCAVPAENVEPSSRSISVNETWVISRTVQFVQQETMRSIVGTRRVTNTNFKGVEKKLMYYVGNVSLTATPEEVVEYLTDLVPGGSFQCVKLKSTGRMQSFKVTASFSAKKILEDPTNWPEGVRVRPWVVKSTTYVNTGIIQNRRSIQNAEPLAIPN